MTKKHRFAALVSAALLLGVAAPAASQPKTAKEQLKKAAEARKEAREKSKEAREKTKEAIKKTREDAGDAEEARKAAKEAREEARDARHDAGAQTREAWKQSWEQLKETRKERRQKRREEIKEKWGDLTKHPAVRAELKVHAWRLARLTRVRTLAKAAGKDAVVERADKLIAKEKARHDKHMETLKSKGGEE
ncbi:MAG: hypothetical protein KC776_05015 [Myxococcales bacterium]|nr:hypothetical protein [Myxococcales bacterium]MCB9580888.1 hypothetical protein [Polyangiaceae bacterium]